MPIANSIIKDLEGAKSKSASVLLVTIWELGEAAGPLFISPLSEVFGRLPVMNVCNAGFVGFTILASLADSGPTVIAARFFTGMFVAVNVLNPAIVGDMFPSEERGTAMSLVMLAPLLGGAIGPAISGLIAESLGWRAMLWICAAIATVCEIMFLAMFRETFKVTILNRRARKLRKETGNERLRTVFETEGTKRKIWENVMRPFAVFYSSIVLQAISLFGSVVFAYFYIMSTTLPDIMQDIFNLTPAQSGVTFLMFSESVPSSQKRYSPLTRTKGLGSLITVCTCNIFLDRIYIRLRDSNKGIDHPEYRLPLCIIGGCSLPFTIAFYGWSTHLPLPIMLLSVLMLGVSIMLGFLPMISYVVDAFGLYSASAMTSLIVTRCLMGTFLPLATEPLQRLLGYGPAFTVWAVVILLLVPIPMLVQRYGPELRQRTWYTEGESTHEEEPPNDIEA